MSDCRCPGCSECEKANGIKIGWDSGGPRLIVCTVCRRRPFQEGLCGHCLDEQVASLRLAGLREALR